MPDNIQNIPIPKNTWIDLYAQSGVTVGTRLIIENVGTADIFLAVSATEPTKLHDAYNILKRPPSDHMQNSEGDLGAWAFSPSEDGKVQVSPKEQQGFFPTTVSMLADGFGNPLASYFQPEVGRYALNIHDADVHTKIINKQFYRPTANSSTLTVAANAGDISITVADATAFVSALAAAVAINQSLDIDVHDNPITVQEGSKPEVKSITGNVLNLDRPLDNSYAIGDSVDIVLVDMATTAATIAAPLSYKIFPILNDVFHITRILIAMIHGTAGDNGLFGDLDKLTNGVILRRYDGLTGTYATFTNWKINADIVTDMYDVIYSARSGGGGSFGTNARGTFKAAGAVIRLDALAGDFLEVLIQDDITLLDSFRIKAQGHFEVGDNV